MCYVSVHVHHQGAASVCSTISQPFVTHESHGNPNQTVCSYKLCVRVTAWLNVLHAPRSPSGSRFPIAVLFSSHRRRRPGKAVISRDVQPALVIGRDYITEHNRLIVCRYNTTALCNTTGTGTLRYGGYPFSTNHKSRLHIPSGGAG